MSRSNRYGRPGPDGPATAALVEWWAKSAEMQRDHPGPGEWVPVNAIQVDLSILPRTRVDEETVQRYRDAFLDLPPIAVQRDTFTLIGGLHRMSAANGVCDYIRIVERDVADADLEDAALEDNRLHGLPLDATERKHAARKLLQRHHPDTGGSSGVAWPVAEIVRLSGMQRDTIEGWVRLSRRTDAEPRAHDTSAGILHTPAATSSPEADAITADDGVPYVDLETGEVQERPRLPNPAPPRPRAEKPVQWSATGGYPATDGGAAAFARLVAVVEAAEERNPEQVLEGCPPEKAGEVYALAERLAAYWGRVADAALRLQAEMEPAAL